MVQERANLCSREMDKVLDMCQRRKVDLQRILEQSRIWEELRLSIETWLNEGIYLIFLGKFISFASQSKQFIGLMHK